MSDHIVRVGVCAVIRYGTKILMGKRKGSHGAGTWSFPGGHLEWNETVAECIAREVKEETSLPLYPNQYRQLTFTNDIFTVEDKHYITLYMEADWNPNQFMGHHEPKVMEPNKCEEWRWMESPPDPLFLPVRNLLESGFELWRR
jgi:8-oxo-dGTP diphosphatase